MSRLLPIAALFVLLGACSPKIGDDCGSSIDCDINGTRICDLSQPDGYCTIRNCEVGTCPSSEAACVEFSPAEPRLSVRYCMAKCDGNGDCRGGYRCVSGSDIGASVLDDDGQRFCARNAQ